MSRRSARPAVRITAAVAALVALLPVGTPIAEACTRFLYETGNKTYITGRPMDWMDASARTVLWSLPRGMARDGAVGAKPIRWTATYGSVATSFHDVGTADGMNEKGLVANLLYLEETDWGDAAKTG